MKEIQSPEAFAEMLRAYDMDVSVEESMAELRKPLEAEGKTTRTGYVSSPEKFFPLID